jgi:hypothetical protein
MMPFEMTVNKQELGTGTIWIHGLGEFGNGVHEISDEQELNFRNVNGIEDVTPDMDPASPTHGQMLSTHELGPSLMEAAESMHGVTVTEVSASAGQKKSGAPVESGASQAPVDNDKAAPEGGVS